MAYSAEERSVIYALCDPSDGRIRYIGKAKDAEKRLKGHLREKRRRSPLYSWIASLRKQGLKPTCKILEDCVGDWCGAEKRLIAQYREQCPDLLNLADGGDEPKCSLETRRQNGQNLVNHPNRDFWLKKAKISIALRHGWVSEHTKEKMRAAAIRHPKLFADWANV